MVRKREQSRMREMLSEAIMVLCKASLEYRVQFSVEGLIGITLDNEEIFLINLNEKIQKEGISSRSPSPVSQHDSSPQDISPSHSDMEPTDLRQKKPSKREHNHEDSASESFCRSRKRHRSGDVIVKSEMKGDRLSFSDCNQASEPLSSTPIHPALHRTALDLTPSGAFLHKSHSPLESEWTKPAASLHSITPIMPPTSDDTHTENNDTSIDLSSKDNGGDVVAGCSRWDWSQRGPPVFPGQPEIPEEEHRPINIKQERKEQGTPLKHDNRPDQVSKVSETAAGAAAIAPGNHDMGFQMNAHLPQFPVNPATQHQVEAALSQGYLDMYRNGLAQRPRNRTHYSVRQVTALEAEFRVNQYPDKMARSRMAASLGINYTQVKIWFQNRRQKEKKAGEVVPGSNPSPSSPRESHEHSVGSDDTR